MMESKMTKEELIQRLHECAKNHDIESAHSDADYALIEYINDDEVEAAFDAIDKWYA